jgi:tetratricopeptide (TPR) repeat protein
MTGRLKKIEVIQMTKKTTSGVEFKFLVVFFIIFVLSGCVTVDKGYKVEGAESNAEMQISSKFDDELFSKKLPAMTADEYEMMGDSLLSKGNLHLAFLQYERSLECNPLNIRVEYKKGLTLLAGEKSDDAIKQFNIVLQKNPAHAAAYEGLGRAFFQKKNYRTAEQHFRKALELDLKLWKSHNFLGNIYDYQAKYEKAIHEYKNALTLKPKNGVLYNNLGVSYSLARKHLKAVDAFSKALSVKYTKSKVYNNLGLALANLGRYAEALESFKKGAGEARAYNNLGCIYLSKGMIKEAVHSFEKAIEVDPVFYAKASENLNRAKISLENTQ